MNSLLAALAGGVLIGASSFMMLALLGRITGISGIFASAITGVSGNRWRWLFLIGLIAAQPIFSFLAKQPPPEPSAAEWPILIIAGLLVGFGTRYAGGCTSGHGVCGIGRLSPRSMAATATFIAAGMMTVAIAKLASG